MELKYHTNPVTHAYITKPVIDIIDTTPLLTKTLLPNVTVPNAMLPNVTVPNAMIPNLTEPNAMLPKVTVPNEMLPIETIVNGICPKVTVPNAIVLFLLHTNIQNGIFDNNMGLKHSKQSIAAATWTQQATLLQVPIPRAELAASFKTTTQA